MGLQLCPHSIPPGVGASAAENNRVPGGKTTTTPQTHPTKPKHQKINPDGKKVQSLIAKMFEKKKILEFEPKPNLTEKLDPTTKPTPKPATTPKSKPKPKPAKGQLIRKGRETKTKTTKQDQENLKILL